MKQEADALGLRSRLREGAGGAQSGGNAFDRGHIHHLLTNPIYAGRIRLTPSHTKTRNGTRLRYYISHRLVARSGEVLNDAWRLPAPELGEKVAASAGRMISAPGFAAKLMPDADADRIGQAAEAFSAIAA